MRRRSSFFAAAGVAAALLGATAASAAAAETVLLYTAYAGGLRAATIEVAAGFSADYYETRARLQLAGIPAWFSSARIEAAAAGRANGTVVEPQDYSSTMTTKSNRVRRIDISYNSGRLAVAEADPPPEHDRREAVPETLRDGALDPFAAVFALLGAVEAAGRCDGAVALYDGRRLFDVTLVDHGTRELAASRFNAFSGTARVCRLVAERAAGFDDKEMERNTYPRALRVLLGRPPGVDRLVPVRFEFERTGGLVVIHLTTAETVATGRFEDGG